VRWVAAAVISLAAGFVAALVTVKLIDRPPAWTSTDISAELDKVVWS